MSNQATLRLQKEYKALLKEPLPNVQAHPLPSNILEWHYVLKGGPGTHYEGGYYHGKVVFPEQYPFRPPAIFMTTPSGRFTPNTRLCLSMSDFHPETWNPMWSVSTILAGLYSFMGDTTATTGSITASKEERKRLARESLAFNLRNPTFVKVFPDVAMKLHRLVAEQKRQEAQAQAGAPGGPRGAADGAASGDAAAVGATSGQASASAMRTLGMSLGSMLGTGVVVVMLLAVMAVPLLSLSMSAEDGEY